MCRKYCRPFKKQYLQWNRDSVNDDLIKEHLAVLSGGKLKLREDFVFPLTKELLEQLPNAQVATPKNNNKKPAPQPTAATRKKRKNRKKKSNNNNHTISNK